MVMQCTRFERWRWDRWELEIYFSDGHKPVKIYGDNAYPYNFKELQELLGMKPYDTEEDEDEEI